MRSVLLLLYSLYCFNVHVVTTYYNINQKMISLKHIKKRVDTKVIKLKF